jgi:hypothetical protein
LKRARTIGLAIALLASPVTAQVELTHVRETAPFVLHTVPGLDEMGARLLQSVAMAPPLPALSPDVLVRAAPIRIYLAPDEQTFARLTGGRAPEWGAGVADPEQAIIILPAYVSTRGSMMQLPAVLRHEIAHVALQHELEALAIPRWFSEGYATWAAGQLDFEAGWLLRLAFLTGNAPPLDSLILDWPSHATDARVAYLLSASAIEWLHARGGERALRLFFADWKRLGRFDQALRATYGLTPGQLERYWSRDVRRRYGWLLFFGQATVAWAVLTLLALILFAIRRRRDRRKLRQLRESELPDQPAFWLESGDAPDATGEDQPETSRDGGA